MVLGCVLPSVLRVNVLGLVLGLLKERVSLDLAVTALSHHHKSRHCKHILSRCCLSPPVDLDCPLLASQRALTLWDLTDCGPSGFSIHGILQARILEWVAFSSAGELSNPGIEPMSLALQVDIYHLSHLVY